MQLTEGLRKGVGPTGEVTWADRIYTHTWLINHAGAICDLIDAATEIDAHPATIWITGGDDTPLKLTGPAARLRATLTELKGN